MAAGASLLNLANPVQNPYFLGDFFQNFPKTALDIPAPKTFSHFGKILHPEKKNAASTQDCYFTCKNSTAIAQA
jgi:hypothetical protein